MTCQIEPGRYRASSLVDQMRVAGGRGISWPRPERIRHQETTRKMKRNAPKRTAARRKRSQSRRARGSLTTSQCSLTGLNIQKKIRTVTAIPPMRRSQGFEACRSEEHTSELQS